MFFHLGERRARQDTERRRTDTYVRLQLDKAKLSSATVKHCADSAWEEAFVQPVGSEESDLAVAIFADRSVRRRALPGDPRCDWISLFT